MSVSPMLKTFFWCVKCTLSLCIHCKIITKNRGFYKKKNCGFSKSNENRILLEANFFYFDQLQTFPGSPTKFGPDWFSRDVYGTQTNRQTSKVYINV